jgi:hypothetical protein
MLLSDFWEYVFACAYENGNTRPSKRDFDLGIFAEVFARHGTFVAIEIAGGFFFDVFEGVCVDYLGWSWYLFIYVTISLPIHLSTYPSLHPSLHPPTNTTHLTFPPKPQPPPPHHNPSPPPPNHPSFRTRTHNQRTQPPYHSPNEKKVQYNKQNRTVSLTMR